MLCLGLLLTEKLRLRRSREIHAKPLLLLLLLLLLDSLDLLRVHALAWGMRHSHGDVGLLRMTLLNLIHDLVLAQQLLLMMLMLWILHHRVLILAHLRIRYHLQLLQMRHCMSVRSTRSSHCHAWVHATHHRAALCDMRCCRTGHTVMHLRR